jgi:hypothetical protein
MGDHPKYSMLDARMSTIKGFVEATVGILRIAALVLE